MAFAGISVAAAFKSDHSYADYLVAGRRISPALVGLSAMATNNSGYLFIGAIGYTYEQDLHVWMKRAWSLDLAFGTGAWHRARVADAVIDGTEPVRSFGYSAPKT